MEDLKQLSDWQLIEECLRGDDRAWQLLHDRYHSTLRSIIWSHLREDRFDSHLVEDIAQMAYPGTQSLRRAAALQTRSESAQHLSARCG
jgi:hypothetical protein